MRVLVFGASGGTGRQVVAAALARQLDVTAFVRRPERLPVRDPRLRVVQGDVADARAVQEAVAGHDAVVSTLGVGRPLRPDPVVVDGVGHVVRAMETLGVARLVYLSFVGLADSRSAAGPLLGFAARVPLRHEVADHERKEATVRASPLRWTIVRAPTLTNGPFTGRYRSGETIAARSLLPLLSRADVADFLLGEAAAPRFERRVVRLFP